MNPWYYVLIVLGGLLLLFFCFSLYVNYRFNPKKKKGNSDKYAVKNVVPLPSSPLKGKLIYFLGSSVTFGAASFQEAVPEFLAKRNSCTSVKEAVSGTTLADINDNSYVKRLTKLPLDKKPDAFILQLSTNDANIKTVEFGKIAEDENYDTKTTLGAIEYIASYVKKNFGCPMFIYFNPPYGSQRYAALVEAVKPLVEKWHLNVIDLYSDPAYSTNLSKKEKFLYMNDPVHPTKAGYLIKWTPLFEKRLEETLK
ncbi:MAG: SGNH/GDSL hydrolase family protein [Bacilli bacterium]|jgi:lysophospholipase L1-like esterase|nr:SGNH/GDSL hydrolase family protein [Bacilli bacterium]